MFKPQTLKTASYIALVCCILGTIFDLILIASYNQFQSYISLISWALLLYSSYLSIMLTKHDLYEEDFKRMGYYIYGILVLFVLFLIFNLSAGILPAAYIAYTLHIRKRGFDSYMNE
jgi:predicted membrane channel-forming protein YqfA (hemolysin III family)